MSANMIVVGIDGSVASLKALDWALRRAAGIEGTLTVVHSWHAPQAESAHLSGIEPAIERGVPARAMVAGAIASAVEEFPPGAAVPVTTVVSDIPAKRLLCDAAEGADMLVVGARGHGYFDGLLAGSVSEYVVRHAPCSVLVLR